MSAIRSDLLPNQILVPIGTQAATITLPAGVMKSHGRIKSVSLQNQTLLAVDAVNKVGISLNIVGGANLASGDSAAGAAALAELPIPLAGGAKEVDVPKGSALSVTVTKNGTGVPTQAVLQIEWYPV
jgi:hypothetical protein